MKIYILAILLFLSLMAGFIFAPIISFAVETMSESEIDHTAREEAEGKEVFERLQSKEKKCEELKNDDFQVLGEYFMGQMTGTAHSAMNNMITQMHGEEGEKQMHIVMGARLSGCDTNVVINSKFSNFMPMMNTMMKGWSVRDISQDEAERSFPFWYNQTSPEKSQYIGRCGALNSMMNMMYGFGNNNMMSWGGVGLTFGIIGLILMVLWWLFVVAAIVFLIKWIAKQFRNGDSIQKSVLDILKERYARGEIDKKEFEEKKKDLS